MAAKKEIKDEGLEIEEKALPLCYGHYRTFGQSDCPKVDCKHSKTCFLDEIFGALLT